MSTRQLFHSRVEYFESKRARKETNLNAALEDVARQRETFLAVDWLTENDQLLKQEDPPLLGAGQEAAVLLDNGKGVLLKELPLGCDLPLGTRRRKTAIGSREKNTNSHRIVFLGKELKSYSPLSGTSKPCSRPTFIMSLQRLGTKHMTSTAFYDRREMENERGLVLRHLLQIYFTSLPTAKAYTILKQYHDMLFFNGLKENVASSECSMFEIGRAHV